MEITRRNFIQLLAGGAAGIHMTPLPWKLMDDTAIWTQNWPWVPVPEVGAFSHEKTVCQLCPGGCGIEVRMAGDRAVKIEGRTDYPVNPGGICPLGAGGLQLLYDETIRFTSPMKRVGPRGSGEFVSISWKEALETLAGRIKKLRGDNRPEGLAAIDGHRWNSTVGLLVKRLLLATGSPNYMTMPSIEDTYATANLLMLGTSGPMAYDLENSDYILSFGPGLIEGWGAPGRIIDAWGRWHEDPEAKRPKITQVESRASNTASKADSWIAPRPGTEAALALGMAHVMIRENLVHSSFLANYTHGFDDWRASDGNPRKGFKNLVLQKYSPESVAETTGVKSEKIIEFAREFGKSTSPLALYGKGKGELNGSVLECMAVQSLNALKGNINKPGGVIVHEDLPFSPWPDISFDAVASQGLSRPRLDGAGSSDYPFSSSIIGNFAQAVLENSEEKPVDTLLVLSANPAFTLPGAGAFRKALEKIPFIVSFSPYRDETAMMADLILPDHTALEKMEDTGWPTALQYPFFGVARPVVSPLYNTRHTGDTVIKIAHQLGGTVADAFPWKGFEGALKDRLEGLADVKGLTTYDESEPPWELFPKSLAVETDYDSFDDLWDNLQSDGFWYRPSHDFYKWLECFKTPSGKLEFYSNFLAGAVEKAGGGASNIQILKNMGLEARDEEAYMPHFEPVTAGRDKGDELVLVPYELFNLSTGWLPSPPFLTKTLFDNQLRKTHSFAEINPDTAKKHGLLEGNLVTLQSDRGEIEARIHIFEGAMPGSIYLPLGLGHTAGGVYLKGKGANPAEIIAGESDPISGQKIWWNTRVKVKKA